MKKVTAVLTSCGRLDLLTKTIESFNKFNTYPIAKFIFIDDSGDKKFKEEANKILSFLLKEYDYSLIFNEKRQGQIKSVDYAYSMVETPYIFHLEDDWEFYQSYFIEHSLKLMEEDSKLITVWLRELNDTMDHPVSKDYKFVTYLEDHQPLFVSKFFYLEDFKGWSGFTFNPGLRRHRDYKSISPFTKHISDQLVNIPESLLEIELTISKKYRDLGFKAAIFEKGYVRHIGWENTTKKSSIL